MGWVPAREEGAGAPIPTGEDHELIDAAMGLVHQAVDSPWLYLVLFGLAALDGFLPVVPGEAALVTAAVFAASGDVALVAVVLAGAVGAFAGDHVSYLIGRCSLGRFGERVRAGARGRAYDRAGAAITERGGQILLASRAVPGVRTATTIAMGGVRYPVRRFSAFDAVAATCWAAGWSLVGHIGGATFGSEPLKGLVFALGLAVALTGVGELARRLWRRRRDAGETDGIQARRTGTSDDPPPR